LFITVNEESYIHQAEIIILKSFPQHKEMISFSITNFIPYCKTGIAFLSLINNKNMNIIVLP